MRLVTGYSVQARPLITDERLSQFNEWNVALRGGEKSITKC